MTRPAPESRRRILDANLNRSAEALRVVEDICRFHWELPGLAGELKALRHELLATLLPDPARRLDLLGARDADGDVGRDIPSPAASSGAPSGPHGSLGATAIRNLQRLKESLRSLEETVRPDDPQCAAAVAAFRYRSYSAEKALLTLLRAPAPALEGTRLCLLWTRGLLVGPPGDVLQGALDGGVSMLQLREPAVPDREVLASAGELRERTARAGALFIVNDRVDIALAAGADGAHLGQDDLPLARARPLAPAGFILGVSTHSIEQARAAERDGADYVGVGPVFDSSTKPEAGPGLGPGRCAAVFREISLPAFAIGGIRPDTLKRLVDAGVRRVAVSSAILSAPSGEVARQRAARMVELLQPGRAPSI